MEMSCPRCGSSNTKFCYYNNYSLTQPRYFCKGCKRYWTKGGSLRNVPVGGGCRKHRRSRSIRASTAEAASRSASLGYFSGGLIKGRCFDSIKTVSAASAEASHIDIAMVYANYLNQKPESKEEEPGGGFDDQFTSNDKRFEPSIEFLSGNDLLGCDFLSNFFADNQMYQEGLDATDTTHQEQIRGCDDIDQGNCNYSLPPLPNQEMATHVFPESELFPAVFGLEGQDPSFIIANWRDFDSPLDDAFAFRK